MFNILRSLNANVTPAQKLEGFSSISAIGAAVVNVMFGLALSMSFVTLGVACIQYIFSQGDPKRLETAWRAFIWSVVSAMIALGAFAVRTAIINAYGVTAPEITNNVPGF